MHIVIDTTGPPRVKDEDHDVLLGDSTTTTCDWQVWKCLDACWILRVRNQIDFRILAHEWKGRARGYRIQSLRFLSTSGCCRTSVWRRSGSDNLRCVISSAISSPCFSVTSLSVIHLRRPRALWFFFPWWKSQALNFSTFGRSSAILRRGTARGSWCLKRIHNS